MIILDRSQAFRKRNSKRMKKLWDEETWKEERIELIRSGVQSHWHRIKQGLLDPFQERHVESVVEIDEEKKASRAPLEKRTPVKQAEEEEQKRIVQESILGLSPEEREAIVSIHFEENTKRTTARKMGISLSELGVILKQAHQKLAQKLKGKF